MPLSAHQFKEIYEDLGYDLSKLGCIMLKIADDQLGPEVEQVISDDKLYYAHNKSRFWIDGNVSDNSHVTLLYGLLRSGPEFKKHVDTVLADSIPKTVSIDHVGFFESPYEDEPYYCIVAHLNITEELTEANERLKFLPHINTFPGYKAHVTLAYIKKEADEPIEALVRELDDKFAGWVLTTGELDYGGDK